MVHVSRCQSNANHYSGKLIFVVSWSFILCPRSVISNENTNSEFAKSEQKYPVKITLAYAH
jgi:hypothetical protein